MKRLVIMVTVLALLAGCLPALAAAAPEVPAKSALLMEVATGQVLYEQQADTPLAPASVTKVMTMLLIMEAIDSGTLGWEDTVTASEAAAAKGGSQIYLKVGEAMSVADMVKSIAVSSANDCACAMAEHLAGSEAAFVEKMNQRAQELGMENTHFVNCTGLDDDPEAAKHRTSARDIAIMSRELLAKHPKIKEYTTIWMDTVRNGSFGLSNTNKLVRFYSGATGLKTGFTAQAGYCLSASAQRDGMELVAVVMGCESSQERFAACKALLDYGFSSYSLVEYPTESQTVQVKLGQVGTVEAVPGQEGSLLIDKSQKNTVNIQTEVEESVDAPVHKGQRLGTMTVRAGEQVLAQIPMVARESVQRLTFWELFARILRKVCMA